MEENENAIERYTEAKPAPYNRQDEIIADLFKKKCNEFWTNYELKEYLVNHYGYAPNTAQKYTELMWKKIKESAESNYEETLAATVLWFQNQIKICDNPFIRLQYAKELNKISGLHIQKISVEGQINHIDTIRISEVLPPADEQKLLTEGENTTQ